MTKPASAMPAAPPPLQGRFTELSLAKSLLREGKQGRPSLLLVGGEDGVGKTRLAAEIEALGRAMGYVVAGASFRRDDPELLSGVSQLVGDLVGALDEEEVRQALSGLPPSLCDFMPVLARFRDPRASDVGALADPEAERLRLYDATRLFLTRLCEGRSMLWLWDDLHNARDGELKLLAFLARTLTSWHQERREPLPIVAVATHRLPLPEGTLQRLLAQATEQKLPVETIRLPPLSERDTFELARALVRDFPETLRADLYRKTGGNPFFVREALRESRVRGGKVRSLPELPGRVVDLVRARLGRFDENARTVCFAAAALGDQWSLDLLRSVVGMPLGELLRTVSKLVTENVLERDHVERTFRFTHSFVKDAIYGACPPALKQRSHQAAARALEAELSDSARFATLAHHYAHAGERERQIRSLQKAGWEALRRYDGREALSAFDRLLQAYPGLPERDQAALRDIYVKTLSGVVKAARMQGESERAVRAGRDLLSVARKEKDVGLIVGALRDLGEVLFEANEPAQAFDSLDEASRLAREAGARRELAQTISAKSVIAQRLGDPRALALVREAIKLAAEEEDDELLSESLVREAVCLYEAGDDRAAEVSYTRALRLARGRKLPRIVAMAHTARGAVLIQRGELERAIRDFQNALHINRRIGDVRSMGRSLVNMAVLHAATGRWEKAIAFHKRAIVLLKSLGFRGDLAASLFSIGNIECDRRRYRQALDAYGQALAIRKELGERNRIAEIMNNIGICYFEMGDYAKSREHLLVSTSLCLEMSYVLCGVESNMYLGAVTAATGDPEAGLDLIRRALDDARGHGLKAQVATGRHLLGFVLAGQGKVAEGIGEIKAAIEEVRALGLKPFEDRFRRMLKDIEASHGARG